MRPVSNLKSNPDFALSRLEKTQGFIALWNSRPGMGIYEFAAALPLNILFPFTRGTLDKVDARTLKDFLKNALPEANSTFALRSTIRRSMATKTLEFRTPIYISLPSNGGASQLPEKDNILLACQDASLSASEKLNNITSYGASADVNLTGAQVASMMTGVPAKVKTLLTNCLVKVESAVDGARYVLWATWRMSQKEAEYFCNANFLEIKISNLYGPMVDWATSVYGRETNLPETISSLVSVVNDVKQTIAGTTQVKPRVGINGMVVDINQHYYVLPEVDRAADYEQKLMDFGMQDDGSYTMAQPGMERDGDGNLVFDGKTAPKKKLPTNLPIFTDWLNDKFVYSNTAGMVNVFDLGTTVPVKAFHIQKVLQSPLVSDQGTAAVKVLITGVNHAGQIDPSILQMRPTAAEMGSDVDIEKYFRNAKSFSELTRAALVMHQDVVGDTMDFFLPAGSKTEVPYIYQLDPVKGVASLRFLGRMVHAAEQVCRENTEVLYTKLSVMTANQVLAVLGLVKSFAHDLQGMKDQDSADRAEYLDQEPDPAYTVEALPNIRPDFKHLPHQFKVQNVMRKGPKFAIWAVAAGGGKTPITITNTLNELKNKRAKKPVVMCPSHLVAQYVKEIVYVTEGRVNVIPVTNTSFKVHGEDSLRKMIENAPPNTIVVSDFNFIKNRLDVVAYGTKSVTIYRNAEFMRQFQFDMVVVDECHYLKNVKSSRRSAMAKFLQDIPMKRLASGTFVSDTIKDVVSQVALLDPTIFGSMSNFIAEFAEETKGDKVLAWKEGAEADIRERITQHSVYATAKRKEWAALLPPKAERFIAVELTDGQRLLYESILRETMVLIEEALAKNPEMREAMESEDDGVAEQLEAMLRPYMARLEKFLSAPETDQLADVMLTAPEDKVSPKAQMIYKICRDHIAKNLPGKILIFTQYTASAESVFFNAPADLKDKFIHYTASSKMEAKSEYEQNPEKMIMVGVSSSMDTGLNFQHVSRLIRMETVWTPGVLEQGNSRINRPEIKKVENRPKIYFDWLIVNRSVDVTKVGRLISKIISKSKFDEHDNPAYQDLADLPPISITLESIASNNDFEGDLLPYMEEYTTFQAVEKADYEQYKLDNPDKVAPVAVPPGGLLPGSKLMSRVPYVPEMDIYAADKLGLVRYDGFLRLDVESLEGDDDGGSDNDADDEEIDENDPKAAYRRAQIEARQKERATVKDRAVHTEFGDGVITGIGPKRVRVRLNDGRVIRLMKMQVFIITRATTNSIDMRNELLKSVGEIPLDKPITVPVEDGSLDKKRKAKGRTGEDPTKPKAKGPSPVEFDFTILNDHLGIQYRGDTSDQAIVNALTSFGFRASPDYTFSRIGNHRILLNLFKAWASKGFTIDKETSSLFKGIYEAVRSNKTALQGFGFATKQDLKNFYREQVKPSADPTAIKVYPMIQDGVLYVMLPTRGQPGNQKAVRVVSPGIRWKVGGGEDEIIKFVTTKQEAKDTIKALMEAQIGIVNAAELGEQFKVLKLVNRR